MVAFGVPVPPGTLKVAFGVRGQLELDTCYSCWTWTLEAQLGFSFGFKVLVAGCRLKLFSSNRITI